MYLFELVFLYFGGKYLVVWLLGHRVDVFSTPFFFKRLFIFERQSVSREWAERDTESETGSRL